MSLALFGGFASLILGGTAVVVPTYLYTKWTNVSSNNISDIKQSSTKNQSPKRKVDPQTQIFNDCLDKNLKFQATNNIDNQAVIISVDEVAGYLKKKDWTVESLYKSQCREYNS